MLRSYDQSQALRRQAGSARHAVIIGAGFIGCEVAASLRALGVDVVLVEPQPEPLASVLGEKIGALVTRLHRAEGVDVRTAVGVAEVRVTPTSSRWSCRTAPRSTPTGGGRLIGSRPATDWLAGTGIEVDNGVVCDKVGRTSAPHVWALGDVTSWQDAAGHQARVEHWSNVAERAGSSCPRCGQDVRPSRSSPILERPVRREDPVGIRPGTCSRRGANYGRGARAERACYRARAVPGSGARTAKSYCCMPNASIPS